MLEVARAHQSSFKAEVRDPATLPVEPMSLRTLIDVLRRRRLVLGFSVAAALALGVAYIVVSPAKYAATATLLIDFRRAQLSQAEESASIVDQAAVDSQIELLRSEKIILAVINKLNLTADPEFGKDPGDAAADGSTAEAPSVLGTLLALPWTAKGLLLTAKAELFGGTSAPIDGVAAPDPAAAADLVTRQTIAMLSRDLWVSRLGRSYLVSVTFNSSDPAKASRIANEVAQAYISDQIGAKVQSAKDANAWFSSQVNEMRTRAAAAYRAVQEFKAEHDINPLRDFGVEQDIDRLSQEASRARGVAAKTRAGLDRAASLLNGPLRAAGTVPDSTALRSFATPDIDQALARYQALRASQAALGDPTTADPEAVRRIADDEAAITREIWDAIARVADQDKADWIAAYAQQQALESHLADVRLRDTRARLIQERLRELETAAATSRSLYESNLNQLTHAAQQQPVPASDARVITAATEPLFPSSPRVPLTLVLALLAGIALGVTWTFLLESTDDVIRTRRQLEEAADLPYLGIVPRVRMPRRFLRREKAVNTLGSFGPALLLSGQGRRRSRAADTLQSLRLAADAGLTEVSATVIGITSAVSREGKSTIAANLAVSAAASGRRVLLVDCNPRNASLSAAFGPRPVNRPLGLDGGYSMKDAAPTDEGVDVLPLPPAMGMDGTDLPDVHLLGRVVSDARVHYDYVILDLPAILPLGNVRAVVNLIDVVIVVTRWGRTTTQQLDRALAIFPAPNRILGLVFNQVRVRAMRRFEGSRARCYGDPA